MPLAWRVMIKLWQMNLDSWCYFCVCVWEQKSVCEVFGRGGMGPCPHIHFLLCWSSASVIGLPRTWMKTVAAPALEKTLWEMILVIYVNIGRRGVVVCSFWCDSGDSESLTSHPACCTVREVDRGHEQPAGLCLRSTWAVPACVWRQGSVLPAGICGVSTGRLHRVLQIVKCVGCLPRKV